MRGDQRPDRPGSSYSGLDYFGPADPVNSANPENSANPAGPAPPRRVWWAAAALAVAVFAAAAIVLTVRGASPTVPFAEAPTTPAAPPSPSHAPEPPLPTPAPRSVAQVRTPAVIAGWQGLKDPREKTAYDIPPNWTVDPPDTGRGYGTDDGTRRIILHGTAVYQPGFCTQDNDADRGFAGWEPVSTNADPDTVAGTVAYNMAAVAGADKNTLPQHPVPTVTDTLVYGGRPARTATSTVTLLNPAPCDPPRRTVVTVSFKATIGQVLFVVVYDSGVPGEPGPDTLNKMTSSLRDSTWP